MRRMFFVVLAMMLSTTASPLQSRETEIIIKCPDVVQHDLHDLSVPDVGGDEVRSRLPNKHPRVIVALGGGGCKAITEVGVLRSLEKNHIPIDGIVGNSFGALIGSLYCAGVPLDKIEELFVGGEIPRALGSKRRFKLAIQPLVRLLYIFLPRPYAGVTAGKPYHYLLERYLPASFDELKIPFAAVATDLTAGRTEVLCTGNLPLAVLASSSVPPLYRPSMINGHLYVDGGLKANVPVRIAREKMCADIVIAVNIDTSIQERPNSEFKHVTSVVGRVADIVLAASDLQQSKDADVLIYPNTDDIPMLTKDASLLTKGAAFGEAAGDSKIPLIQACLQRLRTVTSSDSPTPIR